MTEQDTVVNVSTLTVDALGYDAACDLCGDGDAFVYRHLIVEWVKGFPKTKYMAVHSDCFSRYLRRNYGKVAYIREPTE